MLAVAPMKITRAYKVELDPNNAQKTALLRHCGAARFVYNWGLARKIEQYKAGEKVLSAQKLDGELRGIIDEEFPWLREVSKEARQSALANLDAAYKNFFDRCKKGKKGKATGFPKFKSRKKGVGSYRCYGVAIEDRNIRLPKLGRVRLKEKGYLPCGKYGINSDGLKIVGTTISEKAGRWFVSVQVEQEIPDLTPRATNVVGVDFGIKMLATCSDGTAFDNPKALKSNLRRLKRVQRAVTRKQKGSANRKKAVHRLATAHARVANIRRNALHQISNVLTRDSSVLVVEDLNVAGLLKNRHLAQSLGDVAFGELRRQLSYKAQWRGVQLVVAPRFYPSSKTCSCCGEVRSELKLSERTFKCSCGFTLDRDLNAAINLRNVAGRMPDTLNACGGGSFTPGASVSVRVPLYEAGTKQLLMFAV